MLHIVGGCKNATFHASCGVGPSWTRRKTKWAQSKIRILGGENGGCDFVDPRVLFEETEWSINMDCFLNFIGSLFDESGNTSGKQNVAKTLATSLIKLVVDRQKTIVRPPYAHELGQHSWPRTACYLLCNSFPAVSEAKASSWKAWHRRFLVLPVDAAFVCALEDAEPSLSKLGVDADIENFVTSGLHAAMYPKRHIQHHVLYVIEEQCIHASRSFWMSCEKKWSVTR